MNDLQFVILTIAAFPVGYFIMWLTHNFLLWVYKIYRYCKNEM